MDNYTGFYGACVAHAAPSERAAFIRRTYAHLAGAVLAFIGVEFFILKMTTLGDLMFQFIASNQYGWLMILGGFMLCGWLATGFATNVRSTSMQYFGLLLYVIAEAVIFAPLLYIAMHLSSPDVIPIAAILTLLLFGGLTFTAFTTRKDFSFLGGILKMGFFLAIGLIICATIFGFNLGLIFSFAMVAFAAAAILYDTSKIMYHYGTTQHVAAALSLFASLALLFWYVLRIVMSMRR